MTDERADGSGARRWSGDWALPAAAGAVDVDVLIPTAGRVTELAVTLSGLAAQQAPSFRVIVGDQAPGQSAFDTPSVASMARVLEAEGRPVVMHRRPTRLGLAEQRQFLLEASDAPYVLFLDDDVWLEPGALARMHEAITQLRCGFVGQAVQGLSYLGDRRPAEEAPFEPWTDGVAPERVRPGTPAYDRWALHNAANLAHIAAELHLEPGDWRAYHVAWLGACTMYDRAILVEAGGFDFWPRLPHEHVGEDVAAQWRVMERAGGAGIVPSGAVHLEAPTTLQDRRVNAVDLVFAADR
jgi:glycosyltransferase involved in cell wall biosynthesis